MKLRRNDRCHCGSQRKFKDCCAKTSPNSHYQKVFGMFIMIVVGAWFLVDIYSSSKNAGSSLPTNRVWSEEHGHWHEVGIDNHPQSYSKKPPGLAPKGKVWSEEHGHWHDIVPPKNPNFER